MRAQAASLLAPGRWLGPQTVAAPPAEQQQQQQEGAPIYGAELAGGAELWDPLNLAVLRVSVACAGVVRARPPCRAAAQR